MRRFSLCPVLALLAIASLLPAQTAPLTVDPASREESRQFYRTIFARSELVPLQWTGSATAGAAGDTAGAFKEAVRLRINFFRAMAGVPAAVGLDAILSAKAQQAALMLGANNQISASPPSTWTFYSAAGAEAAANSNLILGQTGADAILAQMRGEGDSNAALPARRWLLYPWTRVMGTGDVPASGNLVAASATWVRDAANFTGARPATREAYVAWPPRGYVPYPVVFPRWSLAYPGADFSAATVTMKRGETAIPVRLEAAASGAGENTLVWVYDNLDARLPVAHAKPAADTTYAVTIAGVRGTGVPASFSYEVVVFDPEVESASFRPPTANGSITPAVGQANPYNFFIPALAASFEWRTLQYAPFDAVFGAEGDLQGIAAMTTGGYAVRDTTRPASGAAAYRLAHETSEPQVLLLPNSYFSPLGAPAVLGFRSLLSAAATQTARVQVAVDDGATWQDVWTQRGATGVGEATFVARSISLADYAGRTVRVRFVLSLEGALPATTGGATGWWVDDITLTGARRVSGGAATGVANESVFRFTPAAAGAIGLQARGVLASGQTQEWGPVRQVVAVGPDGAGDPGRLTNLAIRTLAGTGAQTLIMGVTIGGTGTIGSKPLLIRGVGPSLGAFGLTGFLVDPVLDLRAGAVVLANNDNWANNAQVAAVGTQVGAFPLASATSADAALVTSRAAGPYTVQVTGVGGTTGIALAEVYDATSPGGFVATSPRLSNVSARAQVGRGGDILIAGFSIAGSTEKTLLIRAAGPVLESLGVEGALADPKVEVFSGAGQLVATNDDWVASATLRTASTNVGAFPFPTGSRDAALLVTLLPGSYTAQVSGVGGLTGVGLVEVYEVP